MKWLVLSAWIVFGACERSSAPTALAHESARPAPDAWRCYVRDPGEPARPQGDVTHTRQRLIEGRLELDSVHVQAGHGGATRLVFTPAGDHLEAVFGGVTVIARVEAPDASRWTLAYRDPASGLAFTEENVIVDGVLTVTSTDPGEAGPVKTPVRFVPAACSVVVAELAKYPA